MSESSKLKKDGWIKDPLSKESFKHVHFLQSKLNHTKERIFSEYREFYGKVKKHIVEEARKSTKYSPIKKHQANEIRCVIAYKSIEAKHEFFYELDTLIIDLKRLIEFTVNFLAKGLRTTLKKPFSLENFLNQIDDDNHPSPSNLVKELKKNHPDYVKYIKSKSDSLRKINARRVYAIHEAVIKEVDGFKATCTWNSLKSFEDEPEVNFPELAFAGKPILEFFEEDLILVEEFFDKSCGIYLGFIEKNPLPE